jgi:UDP-glucose 4-epimerase
MSLGRRTAVTGVASFLGARILRRLVEREPAGEVLAIDVAAPPAGLDVAHHRIDLTEPASDQQMLDVLRQERVGTVVHCAYFTTPRRDGTYAHELESIGTLNLLAACAAAGVDHVVLRSFTAVYGARGENPNFLTEDRPLQPNPKLGWVRDKLEAEQHAASFARRYPDMRITVLRFAPLLGPGVHNFYTRLLDHRVVPVLMGYDPLVQVLHPDDALEGMDLALTRGLAGAFNIVPSRPITLVTALHTAAKIPVPFPHPLAYPAVELLWAAGLSEAPGGFVDYARYLFVADGEKARTQLGYTPRHSSRDALVAYLRYRHAAPQLWEAAATA